jgi:hypothetical protein
MDNNKLCIAKDKARIMFDKWNGVTGFFEKDTGYYYEIIGCIEDAVKIGADIGIDIENNQSKLIKELGETLHKFAFVEVAYFKDIVVAYKKYMKWRDETNERKSVEFDDVVLRFSPNHPPKWKENFIPPTKKYPHE